MSPGANTVISEVTNENKLGKADPRSEKKKDTTTSARRESARGKSRAVKTQVGFAAHTAG